MPVGVVVAAARGVNRAVERPGLPCIHALEGLDILVLNFRCFAWQRRGFLSWCLALHFCFSIAAAPRINEIVAANKTGLKDEDGEYSDWIEIFNPDGAPVSLAGYRLTDDPLKLGKWTFPAVTLNPGAYLVVFASGKDRANPTNKLHASFSLGIEGEFLALVAPNGTSVVSAIGPGYPRQFDNVSFGVGGTVAAPVWSYFTTPTPGAANAAGAKAGPSVTFIVKNPTPVDPGNMVINVAARAVNDPVASVKLYYRRMFGAEAMALMNDSGTGADTVAGDGIWAATIPAAAFGPGEMTRWRVVAADTAGTESKEPAFRDSINSPQYYGTVSLDARIQSLLPVLHWFTTNVNAAATETGGRGSIFYEGEFYDNVKFSLHGQSTASFPKHSYNIDFSSHNHFRWRTNEARVRDIDLLTNWADKSKVRHVLAYEIMRAAGVAAHFAFTVRVQHNGNFFSTADFVERGNGDYLERAGLNKDGALYKFYGNTLNKAAGDTGTSGVEKKNREFEGNADLQGLINGLAVSGAALTNYIYDNIDLARCVDQLAANSVIRNIDMHVKNWYLYRDTGRSGEWCILPWDLDLSHGRVWNEGNTYFDNGIYTDSYIVTGTSSRLVSQLFNMPNTRAMIMRRIRTLADMFLQPPPAAGTPESSLFYERRLNEQLALIDPPSIIPSDARRDFEKWGSWLQGGTTVPYTNRNIAVETMARAVQRFKTEYLPARRAYVYNTQVVGKGGQIPLPQERPGTNGTSVQPVILFGAMDVSPVSGNQDQEFVQLQNTNAFAVDISDWKVTGGIEHAFTPGTVIPARSSIYITPAAEAFRARSVAPRGGQGLFVQGGYKGHLSNLGETLFLVDATGGTNSSISYVGQPSEAQKYLVVSELMYHPPGDGLAEFIEVWNTSGTVTLDLVGIHFSQGVDFNFNGSPIQSLAPGARAVVVRDLAAFNLAYGVGRPVAGVFTNGTALDNGGESIKLEDADNQTILEFKYDDVPPWPKSADGEGASLVAIAPETKPNLSLGVNWRASSAAGGNPGGPDVDDGFPTNPSGDADGNGQPDLLDYALGNGVGKPAIFPAVAWQADVAGGPVVLQFTYPASLTASRALVEILYSTDLANWQDASASMQAGTTVPLEDGRVLLKWTIKAPLSEAPQIYLRLRVTPK